MSSLIDASEALGHEALNGECDSGIIHFDATQRRKAKMRQKSQDNPTIPDQNPPATVSKPVPAVEPNLKTPSVSAPQAPSKPAANGAATLAAFSAPAQPPAPAAPSSNRLSGKELEAFLIEFVVEQTGYPPEMVELDADLEADLGIDSIKKAQLFGELAERFQISVDVTDDNMSLDDFPTLGHVMQFLESQSSSAPAPAVPATSANGSAAPVPAIETPAAVNPHTNGNGALHAHQPATPVVETPVPILPNGDLEAFLIEFVVEQTGYPPEMVELDADLEADLGIDSIKKAQLFGELAEQFQISVDVTDDNMSLDDFPTLRHVLEFLQSAGSKAPSANAHNTEAPAAKPAEPVAVAQPSTNGAASSQPEPAAESSSSLSLEELEGFLVNFVVEQTGYPPEMVELDADLEADLGIDSIKKAQMMGELAEQFQISVDVTDENVSLDDFPTLRHVCHFLAAPGKAAV